MFWKKVNNKVMCILCPRNCVIKENSIGICGVRKNINNKLFSLVYEFPCSIAIDPIEKKPLFHFKPGSITLSIATVGCNLFCKHCQNIEISHPEKIFGNHVSIKKLVDMSINVDGFAWTYTEPTVFFEYFYNTAKLTKNTNKFHVWVTNGYTSMVAIKKSSKFLNAVNVDYKGDEKFYKDVCNAHLEPVHQSLLEYKKQHVFIEVTNLIIPNYNDKDDVILEMVLWIKEHLGKNTPLHFSRYFPYHLMHEPPTPRETLEKAYNIAKDHLNYVYIGNISTDKENTYCHNCNELLIERHGFSVVKCIEHNRCPYCGVRIPIVL